jgi:hypothetical protein
MGFDDRPTGNSEACRRSSGAAGAQGHFYYDVKFFSGRGRISGKNHLVCFRHTPFKAHAAQGNIFG